MKDKTVIYHYNKNSYVYKTDKLKMDLFEKKRSFFQRLKYDSGLNVFGKIRPRKSHFLYVNMAVIFGFIYTYSRFGLCFY